MRILKDHIRCQGRKACRRDGDARPHGRVIHADVSRDSARHNNLGNKAQRAAKRGRRHVLSATHSVAENQSRGSRRGNDAGDGGDAQDARAGRQEPDREIIRSSRGKTRKAERLGQEADLLSVKQPIALPAEVNIGCHCAVLPLGVSCGVGRHDHSAVVYGVESGLL